MCEYFQINSKHGGSIVIISILQTWKQLCPKKDYLHSKLKWYCLNHDDIVNSANNGRCFAVFCHQPAELV